MLKSSALQVWANGQRLATTQTRKCCANKRRSIVSIPFIISKTSLSTTNPSRRKKVESYAGQTLTGQSFSVSSPVTKSIAVKVLGSGTYLETQTLSFMYCLFIETHFLMKENGKKLKQTDSVRLHFMPGDLFR